jgi:hypothetical protein
MSDEPNQGSDHTKGLLLLRFIAGKLRLFRVRNLQDAFTRGGPFE